MRASQYGEELICLDSGVFDFLKSLIQLKVDGNKIKLSSKRLTKREKKLSGTFKSHIKNMIKERDLNE